MNDPRTRMGLFCVGSELLVKKEIADFHNYYLIVKLIKACYLTTYDAIECWIVIRKDHTSLGLAKIWHVHADGKSQFSVKKNTEDGASKDFPCNDSAGA